MKITFWSDFACPWCWIGETNLEAALKSLGRAAEFEMKAYELAPNAPKMGGAKPRSRGSLPGVSAGKRLRAGSKKWMRRARRPACLSRTATRFSQTLSMPTG